MVCEPLAAFNQGGWLNASGSAQPVEANLNITLTTPLFAISQWGYVNGNVGYIFNTELTTTKIRVRSIAAVGSGAPGVYWVAFGRA